MRHVGQETMGTLNRLRGHVRFLMADDGLGQVDNAIRKLLSGLSTLDNEEAQRHPIILKCQTIVDIFPVHF